MTFRRNLQLALLLAALPALSPAADGPALYRQHCARCHGENGNAKTWRGYLYFARNFTSADWQAENTDADILDAIDRGPTAMPAFEDRLTREERDALVQVIRGFGEKR